MRNSIMSHTFFTCITVLNFIIITLQNHVRISTRFRLILHNKVYHK